MLQHTLLIVPPTLELLFSFTIAVTSASVEGRSRWILVLDGLSFFVLALSDFLAHVIPKVSNSVHVFSVIDTVIAAASLLPLFFYTVFLFLFARKSLISILPTRFSRMVAFSLLAVIPPTLATNELGSLLGLSHTSVPVPDHAPIVEVGFSSPFHQHLSLFFSAACLALLTLFQALLFMVTFVRITRGFIEERRIETAKQDPQAREEIHLFRGIGWLAVGLKLGAIESVVGFANTSFAVVITRRALRFFARGTLIIGVMKGLNVVEDISSLESDLRVRSRLTRRSKRISRPLPRAKISNPRNSTFQELSPEASSFHAAQLAKNEKRGRIGPSPLALGGASNMARFNDADFKNSDFKGEFGTPGFDSPIFNIPRSSAKTNQRVTVQYDGKTPPVLQLRFSAVDIDIHPLPLPLPNPYDKQNNLTSPGPTSSHVDGPKSPPLQVVAEDPREDQVSLSEPELFYGGYVPQSVPLPRTAPLQRPTLMPLRPPRDPRRASYAAPSFNSDVAMPFRNRDRDSPRSSFDSPTSTVSPSQYIPSPSQERFNPSYNTTGSLRRSARTASLASDSLDAVREIAARFPGLPPRVVPAKVPPRADPAGSIQPRTSGVLSSPPGLRDDVDADADSDSEWRTLARERSLKRRREMKEQQTQQADARDAIQGDESAVVSAGTDISPVNSIKRKPAPSSDQTQGDDSQMDEAASETVVAPAVVTARSANRHGQNPSLDDPLSYYSSSDDDTNDRGSAFTVHNGETGDLTSGPWTPATTVVVTSGLATPASWAGRDERLAGQFADRMIAVGQREDVNMYSSAQPRTQLHSPRQKQQKQPPPQLQLQQPQPRQRGSVTHEERRLRRLTLLRRELRASAHDSATASAALEPELQAPWLHADPLTQLQTIGTGEGLHIGDEDEDAVLDDAWRRAGLTRIKSVNRVRVHMTPRVEQGFDVRGSLVAVEEEDEEEEEDLGGLLVSPMQEQKPQRSVSTLKKPARSDSGVLGEEDRNLIRQGRV